MAAAYCNWLSEREGIPQDQWCYETNVQGLVTKLKENYLSLAGYRLPTEAEWEYACRAGSVTSRYYGETTDLLGKYAWFSENAKHRSWPVGSKKPNDLGLFDMHGNASTLCQESYKGHPSAKGDKAIEDKEDLLMLTGTDFIMLRGGSFNDPASYIRSADRDRTVPTNRVVGVGFRLARTFR
jgi:formylglycine-generating enzyme required for sulfatase activity